MYTSNNIDVFLVIEIFHSLYLEKYRWLLARLDCMCSKVSLRHSSCKKGFSIGELGTDFGKLQGEITNFLENCESTFSIVFIAFLSLRTNCRKTQIKYAPLPVFDIIKSLSFLL